MKYLKLFESVRKYKFKKGDYIKVLPDAGPRVDMENREHMIYKIDYRRKKAQGWEDEFNLYQIKQVYKPYNLIEWEFNEKALRDLTEEEREELEMQLTAKKYNL